MTARSGSVRWTPRAAAQVDSLIPADMRARRVPGAAVAVVSHGRVIFARGYGRADPTGAPVTENTESRIASTTKPFTALAISASGFFAITGTRPAPGGLLGRE